MHPGVDEPLRVADEILDLAVTEGALVARVSAKHHEYNGALGSDLGQPDGLSLDRRQGEVGRLVAYARCCGGEQRSHGGHCEQKHGIRRKSTTHDLTSLSRVSH